VEPYFSALRSSPGPSWISFRASIMRVATASLIRSSRPAAIGYDSGVKICVVPATTGCPHGVSPGSLKLGEPTVIVV